MKINNFLKKNKYYIIIFVLLIVIPFLFKYVNNDLKILKNQFKKNDFLNLFENFQNEDAIIHYGDQIKINFNIPNEYDDFNKNQIYLTCGNNLNNDLTLNNIKESYSADDKLVYLDDNTNDLYQYWMVVGPNGTADDFKLGEAVKSDETIRLQCIKNGANLYLSPNVLSTSFKVLRDNDNELLNNFKKNGFRDVVGQGEYNKTDDNANWTLKLDNSEVWTKKTKFRLLSKNGLSLNVSYNLTMPTDSLSKYKTNTYNTGQYVFEKQSVQLNFDTNNLNKELSNITLNSYDNGYNIINEEFNNSAYYGFLFSNGTLYPVSKTEFDNNKNKGNVLCDVYVLVNTNPLKTIVSTKNNNSFNMNVYDVRSSETHNLVVYSNNYFKSIDGEHKVVPIGKEKSSLLQTLNDMNISSVIVPKGYILKLYASYQPGSDDNRFIKLVDNEIVKDVVFFGGNFNNFTYSKVQGLSIEKYCAGKVFEYSNYKGKMHCLEYGTHKLDKIGSWNISDNTDAKILTSYNDFEISGDSEFRNIANYRAINEVNLDTSNTIVLQPKGTNINIFRNLADLSSVKTMNVPRKSEELPYTVDPSTNNITNIKLENIKLALDFSNPRTYNTLKPGRIARDISGSNNHVVFNDMPQIVNGLLLSNKTNKALGPSPVNFDIGTGIQGYTIFLFAKRNTVLPNNDSNNTILYMDNLIEEGFTGQKHGINIQLSNTTDNNIYFNNGFTKSENFNSQKTTLINNTSNEDLDQLNVYVFRKASEVNGGNLSLFMNGKKIKENNVPSNRLFLDESQYSSIFSNFGGVVQSMFMYNTHLNDKEIGNVVNWQIQNFNKYQVQLNKYQNKILSKVIPELKIYNNLKCLVNSKDKLSSAIDSANFRDLSGLNSHFKFLEIPSKNNGRYENMRNKGKYLVGPPGACLGIDKNTGYTIFMTVRLLNTGNYYLFNIKGNNEIKNPEMNKFNRGISLFVENDKLVLVQGQQNNGSISESVNRISCSISDYINKTITISILNDVKDKTNKGQLCIFINNKLVAKGITNTSSYVNLNSEPIVLCAPHNYEKLENNNQIMDGDLLNFSVYNTNLGLYQLKYVSSYLMKGYFGSDVNIYGNKVTENKKYPISSNFCYETSSDGHLYSNTECLDWNKKDENGRYKTSLPNGSGWCFTKQDGSTRGFCFMDQDFKVVQSVKNDVKNTEQETAEKIKEEAIKEANKELVNANSETNTQQNNESFTNYEPFINEVSVETDYDFDKYNSYSDAVNKCILKKGRLCYPREVSSGNKTANVLFNLNNKYEFKDNHPIYTKEKCKILGLEFDENTKRCYTNENNKKSNLDMLATVNIKEGKNVPLWLPLSLDNNGNPQYINIGEGADFEIGYTTSDEKIIKPNEKLLLKCCDVGNTSLCEGNRTRLILMDKELAKLNKELQELNDSTDSNKEIQIKMKNEKIKELKGEREILQKKLWVECDKHNYFDALTSLKNFRKIYNQLFNEHKRAVYNRTLIEKQMMKYIYFEDDKGVKYVENDSTRSRKRKGLIPDLEAEIRKYKNMIKNELERIENCPVPNAYNNNTKDGKEPSCEELSKKENPTEIPYAQQPKEEVVNKKCSPNDIKNYLINSGKLSQETVIKLLQMSNVNNLLKDTDIRNHKDFYKYVKSSKINSCPKADKDAKITINQKTVKDFNIKDHPEYNKYIRLDTLPENRVPAENMKLWKKLKGLI